MDCGLRPGYEIQARVEITEKKKYVKKKSELTKVH